jgi:hypothetical protein
MLSTKDMSAGSGKARPVISPGNQVIKINKITFDQTPYDKDAYNVVLHVESEPVKGEFDGFLVDPNDQDGPRYKGQVGRVRMIQLIKYYQVIHILMLALAQESGKIKKVI